MLKIGIIVVLEDGTVSHGRNIENCKEEILEKIGEEIDDRVISVTISKKRPMQNAAVDTVTTTEIFSSR